MSDDVRQFTVGPDDTGIRLDRWFKRNLPQIGFGTVSRWARTGQIRVDGKRVKPEDRLTTGQVLRVPPGGIEKKRGPRKDRELSAADIKAALAMEIMRNDAAIALNKPPGLATQGGTKTTLHVDGLLDAFVEDEDLAEDEEAPPRPRLVHRLDKDTSGVLLVARTPGSAAFYSKRFSGRSAKKIYWALVVGVPQVREGSIDAPLSKQPGSGGEKMHVDEEGGQPAKTLYRVVDRVSSTAAWVELQPFTGRTHQLRVHMAAIGHPIVGDGKYGGKAAFLTGSISRKMHLHARRLIIDSPPTGNGPTDSGNDKIDVTADLPEHFAESMAHLGFDITDSDASPIAKSPPERSREEKKLAARQHAKQYRKDQRGKRSSGTGERGKAAGKRGKPIAERKSSPGGGSSSSGDKPAGASGTGSRRLRDKFGKRPSRDDAPTSRGSRSDAGGGRSDGGRSGGGRSDGGRSGGPRSSRGPRSGGGRSGGGRSGGAPRPGGTRSGGGRSGGGSSGGRR